MWHNLNWIISLLFNPLIWVIIVSFWLHPCHWLVRLMDWFEFTDLPQLQSVEFGSSAFNDVHSVVFESDWMDGLMIQICLNYNPFNLVMMLYLVMVVLIEKRVTKNLTTSRTHWQCEVRLNKLMNEQIFLHLRPSEVDDTISRTLERSLLRVLIWRLIDVDVIQSTSSVYEFGSNSFQYTYSVESYSNHYLWI